MLKRYTFMIDDELGEKFKRFCVEENGGKFEQGIYSMQLTKALELLFASKKPKEELIDIEGLDASKSPYDEIL